MDGDGTDSRLRQVSGEIMLLARLMRASPESPDARRLWAAQARGLAAERRELAAGACLDYARAAGQRARAVHERAESLDAVLALCARTCGGPGRSQESGAVAA